jgi:pimeloyl-ACP methyl ester carboxylesterase
VTTPTGFAVFPKDLLRGRRSTAERWYNVQRWTDMPAGGHFGPWEQPTAWSNEIVAFANQLGA